MANTWERTQEEINQDKLFQLIQETKNIQECFEYFD